MHETNFLPATLRSEDSMPIPETHPGMLDYDKVASHIAGATERGRYSGPTDPQVYLLNRQCLAEVEEKLYVTLAGMLCFGRNTQQVLPRAVIDIGHYRGIRPVSFEVTHLEKDIGGTIFDQLARVEAYLWNNTHHGMTLSETSFQRVEIHEYPRPVIRELCVNMLAHRDYKNQLSSARVQLFRNRIEWISPGGLPPGITVENILFEQAARNRATLSVMYEAGYVESFGQGLDTVVAVLEREEMLAPKFHDTGASFIVTVYGRQLEVLQGSDSMLGKLTESQRQLFVLIQRRGELTPRELREQLEDRSERSIQRDLKALLESELIEALGGSRSLRYRICEYYR